MDELSRRLLFQLGSIRFCLFLDDLVEIQEQVIVLRDDCHENVQPSVVGFLDSHGSRIPVVDLAPSLAMPPLIPCVVLVLYRPEGNWALLVDRVDGFCAVAEMTDLPLPYLLQNKGWRCFSRVALRNNTPYLCLDLTSCFSGVQA